MAAKTFALWWQNFGDAPESERDTAERSWNAAWNSAEEKFNSALRQPTNQGHEPSEIAPPVTCECCHEQPAVMNVCHDCYMAT